MGKIVLPESKLLNSGSPLRAGMRMYPQPNYPFGIGSFNTPIPRGSREALAKAARETVDGRYTASWGYDAYREAVHQYLASRGVNVPADSIIGANGASQILTYICAAIVGAGNTVLAPVPSYATFCAIAKSAGNKVKGLRTVREENFALPSRENIVNAVTPDVKMIYIDTPGNPTGISREEGELRMLGDICVEKNIVLCVDASYFEHVPGKKPYHLLSDQKYRGHVIYVFSFSKSFSLMKYRNGFAVCPDEDMADAIITTAVLGEAEEQLCPNFDGMVAAIGAIAEADSYTDGLRKEMMARLSIGLETMVHERVNIVRPKIGSYLFPHILGVNAMKFRHFLMTDPRFEGRRVLVTPGSGFYFGEGGDEEVRIALTIGGEELRNGLGVVIEAIDPFIALHGENRT